MKNKRLSHWNRRPFILAGSLSLIAIARVATAASLTWDITPGVVGPGDSAITGGAGVWDLAAGNWTLDAGVNNIAWTNGDSAIFQDAGGVVTLGAAITADDLTFNVAGYDIAGGTLTLAGTPTVTTTADATISSIIAGTDGLTKTGAGVLTLTGANTFTGTTVVDNGTLVLGSTGGVAINGNVTMGNGTVNQPNLRMAANNQFGAGVVMTFVNPVGQFPRFDLQGTSQTLAGIVNSTGAGVVQNERIGGGGTAAAGTLTLNGAASYTYNGYLRDEDDNGHVFKLSLVKSGAGTQVLQGANITYQGTTTINGGILQLRDTTAFSSVGAMTVNAGGTLSAARTAAGGAARSPHLGNNVVLNGGTLSIDNTAGLAGGWTTFNAANGLTGSGTININSGVLARDNTIANAINTSANVNVAAGAFFGAGRGGNSTINALTGSGVVSTLWAGANQGSITIGNGGGSGTFAGTLDGNGSNATDLTQQGGILSVIKVGTGTQTFSNAASTYSGGTTVNDGRLILQSTRLVAGAKTVNSPGVLEINSTVPFATRYNNSGIISGTGTIEKTGTGVWGIIGTMNFTGTLNILEGRVHNDNTTANWTAASPDVNVSANAVLDLRANFMRVDELNGAGEVWSSHSANGNNQNLIVGIANGSSTFSGIIRGNDSQADENPDAAFTRITKEGTGTFTLSGVNTFTGGVTVNNGTVRISGGDDRLFATNPLTVNGGATFGGTFDMNGLNQTVASLAGAAGAVPGVVSGGGLLTVNGATTTTFAGNLTGGMSLTRAGTGVTALSGASTHSGPTLITGGAIRHGSATAFSPNSNIQLNGGVIEAGFSDLAPTTGAGGGQISWLGNGGFAAAGAPRNVTLNGGGTLTWGAGGFVPDGSRLLFGSTAADSTVTLTNPLDLGGGNRTVEVINGPAAIEAALASGVTNGTLTLQGTAGSLALTSQSTANVVVDNTNATSTNIMNLVLNRAGGDAIAAGLQIGATSNGQFATVRLGAGDQIADTTAVTFGAASGSWSYFNLYGFNETIAGLSSLPGSDGGVLQLVEADASPVTNSTLTLNVASGTQSYLGHIRDRSNGISTDPGGFGRLGFVKEGAGTQELTTWNQQVWSGPTTVNNGTLRIALNATQVLSFPVLNSAITNNATLDLSNTGGALWTHGGAFTGAGSVVKSGAGIVNLAGAGIAYNGPTTVNSGILRLTDQAAFASSVTVNAGAWLEENRTTGSGNFAVSVAGAGGIIKNGDGETILTSPLSVAQVAVRRGVLTAGADNVLTSANILSLGGAAASQTVKLNGTAQTVGGLGSQYDFANRIVGGSPTASALTVNIGAGQQTFYGGKLGDAGADENNLSLTKTGNGTLMLGTSGTYTGGTVIAGGTLQLGASLTMPVNLATLGIWLDGADPAATGTAPADGVPISVWKNKGALGATGDFTAQPGREPAYGATGAGLMNGNATVRFTATPSAGFAAQADYDKLVNPINLTNSPATIIVAGRYAGATADERKRLVSGMANNWLLGWWNNGENGAYYVNNFAPGVSAATTNPHVYTSVIRGDGFAETYGSALGRMGTLTNAAGPNGLALGGGANYTTQNTENSTGDVGELIIVPGVLSDADRGAIEAYLVRKWTGFVANNPLPTGGTIALTGAGATLAINGVTQTTGGISGVAGTSITLGGGSLSVGNDNGDAQFDGVISGAGSLAKVGTGTWTLGGANTYTAITRIQNGVLALSGGADRLPVATSVVLGTTGTGGTLKLGGNNQTVAGLTSVGSQGRVLNGSTTAATFTLNLAGGINNYGGKIGGDTADDNNLAFVKQGAGTLLLTNSSTHTGGTTIAGGTVILGGARTLPATAAIWLDATDGATIATSGGGVTAWANKGTLGASGNFTAPAGNEPTTAFEGTMGGNQVIRFDALTGAGNDQLNNALSFANDVTVAYIGRLAGTANQRLLSATGNNWLLGPWGGAGETAFFNAGFLYNSGVADALPRFHVGTIAANGTSAYYSNGTLLGAGGGEGPNQLRIGGGYLVSGTEFSSGDVGELFVFNGVLNDDQRTQLDSYIARKWFGLGSTDVLPASGDVALTAPGATLDINGVMQTIGGLSGSAGTSVLLNDGNLTVGDTDNTVFAGAISGAGTLTKAGSGTLELSGANTPAGSTYVQGGTLVINGSLDGALLEIQNGGTLGGTGSIGADTYLIDGGKLAPGASPGTLTFTSTTLDISDGVGAPNSQSLIFELGTVSDQVFLTSGQLSIGSSVLEFGDFAFTAGSGFGPGTYTLFDSAQDVFGDLGTSLSGMIGGFDATLSLADTNNDIVLTVVPEPGSTMLLLGGLALMARRRNRQG